MLGPPSTAFVAGLEAVVIAGALLVLGYLIADAIVGKRGLDEVERWGLALGGLCAFCLGLMVIHIATSGWLFAQDRIVLGVTALTGVGLLVRRLSGARERDRSHLLLAGGLVVAALLIWGSPVFRMMPLTATADTQLHNGWIDQLLAGETTPGATITGDVPNYYPWLFHAVGAVTTTITPGNTPYHALAPLQLVQVAGAVLALFALGRALTRRALTGAGAALFGAMSGGFGFVMLNGLDIVTDPRANEGAAALAYQGDLLYTRSYNVGFHNIAPAFPRDLAFALLTTFVLALAVRARRPGPWSDVVAGGTLGMIGLTGGETFLTGGLLAVLVLLFEPQRSLGRAVRVLGPALAVYSLWAIPIVVNLVRLDGFVSITHIIPVALPATAIVVSWGWTIPFGVIGLVRAIGITRSDPVVRVVLLFSLAAGAMLAVSAFIPEILGEAFDTLGRKHRYWPIFYLSAALLAALGFTALIDSVRVRSKAAAAAVILVVTGAAWASPIVGSVALPNEINRYPEIAAAMTRSDESLLYRLRSYGPGCVVAAPNRIARIVFSYTGYRLVLWTGNWFGDNRARIRWAGIYEQIEPEAQRIQDNETLTTARPGSDPWIEAARRHDVDLVVTEDLEIVTVKECTTE